MRLVGKKLVTNNEAANFFSLFIQLNGISQMWMLEIINREGFSKIETIELINLDVGNNILKFN